MRAQISLLTAAPATDLTESARDWPGPEAVPAEPLPAPLSSGHRGPSFCEGPTETGAPPSSRGVSERSRPVTGTLRSQCRLQMPSYSTVVDSRLQGGHAVARGRGMTVSPSLQGTPEAVSLFT